MKTINLKATYWQHENNTIEQVLQTQVKKQTTINPTPIGYLSANDFIGRLISFHDYNGIPDGDYFVELIENDGVNYWFDMVNQNKDERLTYNVNELVNYFNSKIGLLETPPVTPQMIFALNEYDLVERYVRFIGHPGIPDGDYMVDGIEQDAVGKYYTMHRFMDEENTMSYPVEELLEYLNNKLS